jgi:hypothetical protein
MVEYNIKRTTMKTLSILLSLSCVIAVSSCRKDEPDPPSEGCTITCQNGGTVTASCECNCPNGFYGTNCQNQQTPSTFRVNQIVLTSWPATNNQGQIAYPWDNNGTGPDIFFRFGIGTTPYTTTGYINNCSPGTPLTFNAQNDPAHFPFALGWGTTYDLKIMDEDGTQDQVMLDSSINMANFDNGLPTTINLSTGEYAFKLQGVWLF